MRASNFLRIQGHMYQDQLQVLGSEQGLGDAGPSLPTGSTQGVAGVITRIPVLIFRNINKPDLKEDTTPRSSVLRWFPPAVPVQRAPHSLTCNKPNEAGNQAILTYQEMIGAQLGTVPRSGVGTLLPYACSTGVLFHVTF